MFQNPIPIRLKQARAKSGITQKQLGILIGMDENSASGRMNHYEKGRHIPDLTTLKKIADELNVPLNYFFCEDETTAELVIEISKLDTEKKLELIKELKKSTK
ncbi:MULTISPECIES: helix-turn-helix domain-containing protein [Pseudoalteromonas]|uniref:XRE family transcriptional regulator n=1 Tax=Pseudoalteromonas prydzensis TaxID=182141 RepID=A0A7V1GDB8_9GAMM|nr:MULTISPECIES: helix-turn-helix transcriptional regulator [Pseudoalteromonas]MCP4055694.1 helix-turn-helix transcriptional regulator [Mesoflavibacter sp.]MBB1294652.1 helix-turn-helix transcriptional regulator [Pseudoalteromonas sp. SR41-4]MBB1479014.1 helix-turn-helix transcriptional regulator [Pseudoalteromonas sp. SG41-2]MDC9565905.1 helix-turn-helix transcriptional regulator [Pseudoalteromonas sp. GAB2316C]MDC9570238.1 helix-turn-helix transcriptional regulator [Pseudoalteromonas sp. GAB